MQCLVWTTTMAHHRRRRSHFSGNELIKEEQTNGGVFREGVLSLCMDQEGEECVSAYSNLPL